MSTRVKKEYDLVIVGSGIAGLSFALKVAEAGYRVAIFTKKDKAIPIPFSETGLPNSPN